jgi:site-specific recombinase XerD
MTGLFQRNSVWQVKYYQNGKPRYRSLGTKSRDIAEKKLKHIEADLERGILIERSRTSIAAFLSQYSEHLKAKKRLSPRSLRTDISRLRHFFSFIEKEYPSVRTLEGITSAIISEFLSFKVR